MLRSFVLWLLTAIVTILFAALAILTIWIPPRGKLYLVWARLWSRCILAFASIPVERHVSAAALQAPAAIFMANHTSFLDILVLLTTVRQDVRFLAKRSLFFIPVFGWSMWLAGFIPVDRDRKDRAKDAFDRLAASLQQGFSILVFPEGTRSRTGELLAFKKSGFLLALKTGLPIVPVGISGAGQILSRGGLRVVPGRVVVRMGEPIPTAGLGVGHRAELMERVRAELDRLKTPPA